MAALAALAGGCSVNAEDPGSRREGPQVTAEQEPSQDSAERAAAVETQIATLGAGCYWCVEAVFEQLDGVSDVRSGFMGGQVVDPSYAAVCSGQTGHAEVVQVTFDPTVLPYEELLDWFWRLHDPTTLNRQGADVGTQYRSAIFFHGEDQRAAAEASRESAAASGAFSDPIVTEITAAGPFYEATAEHQDYYRANRQQGYCRMVIRPKLRKLELEE